MSLTVSDRPSSRPVCGRPPRPGFIRMLPNSSHHEYLRFIAEDRQPEFIIATMKVKAYRDASADLFRCGFLEWKERPLITTSGRACLAVLDGGAIMDADTGARSKADPCPA